MKKQLDELTIANELRGASKFFAEPRIVETQTDRRDSKPIGRTVERSNDRPDERTVNRSDPHLMPYAHARTDAATPDTQSLMDEVQKGTAAPVRATERYAFEIYTDQKRQLNRIKFLFEQKTGRPLAASRILREAIGPFLDKLEAQLSTP